MPSLNNFYVQNWSQPSPATALVGSTQTPPGSRGRPAEAQDAPTGTAGPGEELCRGFASSPATQRRGTGYCSALLPSSRRAAPGPSQSCSEGSGGISRSRRCRARLCRASGVSPKRWQPRSKSWLCCGIPAPCPPPRELLLGFLGEKGTILIAPPPIPPLTSSCF